MSVCLSVCRFLRPGANIEKEFRYYHFAVFCQSLPLTRFLPSFFLLTSGLWPNRPAAKFRCYYCDNMYMGQRNYGWCLYGKRNVNRASWLRLATTKDGVETFPPRNIFQRCISFLLLISVGIHKMFLLQLKIMVRWPDGIATGKTTPVLKLKTSESLRRHFCSAVPRRGRGPDLWQWRTVPCWWIIDPRFTRPFHSQKQSWHL